MHLVKLTVAANLLVVHVDDGHSGSFGAVDAVGDYHFIFFLNLVQHHLTVLNSVLIQQFLRLSAVRAVGRADNSTLVSLDDIIKSIEVLLRASSTKQRVHFFVMC